MSMLRGWAAAITGASAGIGEACADALSREGIAVALSARRRDRLETIAARITARDTRAIVLPGDVTHEADMRQLVHETVAAFGRLDVMVCNAGIGFHGLLEDTDAETMRKLVDVNLMGTFHAARAAVGVMREANRGHIIIMSSIAGRRGIPGMTGYCATKFAQIGLAESLRAELAGTPVRVSVVYPVSTTTEFLEAMKRNFGHSVSGLGPKQTPGDVAKAVVACLKRPRAEVYPYRPARALAVLNAVAPGFTDRLVQKYGRHRAPSGGAAPLSRPGSGGP
jgi:NADP-dependent 3-hydroxy acid dehydrogenase YdfG